MASIPLPALDVRPAQTPDALSQYGKALQMKSLLGEQQLQQGQLAMQQQQLKDQSAITSAWKNWDGKDPDTLVKGVLNAGGSGNAANQIDQMLMARQQQKNALSESDFKIQNDKNDRMLGRLNAAEDVPDEGLLEHATNAIKQSVSLGDLDPRGAQAAQQAMAQAGNDPKAMRAALDNFKKSYQLESVQFSRAKEQSEIQKNQAQAGLDNANKLLAQNKADVMAAYKANPQVLLSQVDAIAPANKYGSLNQRTKAGIHNALMTGDIDQAKDLLKQASEQVGGVEKDIAVATNPDIQAGKVAVATAEGAAKAAQEAKTARGSNAALAEVPPHLVAPATAAANKAGEDFATANQAAQNLSDFIAEAKSGNKAAVKIVPLQGALEITTAQGVHRINRTEVDQYGGAGSLYDKLAGKVGGVLTGKSIDDSVLDDMNALQQKIASNAQSLHKNKLDVINQTYGSKFKPVEFENAAPGTTGKAPATDFFSQFGGKSRNQ